MSRFVCNKASRRGNMSVEFALIGATLFLVLFACLDVGRYVSARTALSAAVSEAVRVVMADPAMAGCDAPKTFALARTAVLAAANLTLCATRVEPASGNAGSVTVNASYTFSFVMPVFSSEPVTFSTTVTSPI
jgi:Flp pilus assembly protein TadG